MVSWANYVTIGRILAIPLFIIVLYLPIEYKNWIAALVFCAIASTDAVDGWLARRHNSVTRAGAVLDPLADKLLVAAALIFLVGQGVEAWMAYVIIAREFLVTGLRILTKRKEVVHASFWGKLKTLSQIVGIVSVLVSFAYAWHLMLVATVLTVWSGFDYFWRIRETVRL
jgi:CDP-diacylglycerol--glycerol-3-phosphate 3-phosphatidyltransferase